MGTTKIALDTNMLLAVAQFKVDVFEQIRNLFGQAELYVPGQVEEELEKIEKKGKTRKTEVGIARELMEKHNVKVVFSEEKDADTALVSLSEKGYWIATNDKELKKRIQNQKVLYLRKKKFLEKGVEW